MFKHLIDKYLAEHLELKGGQVTTLQALLQVPVMDYQIAEVLQLYPRSKMRKNVLEPLCELRWIIFHSLPPATGNIGAPRIAWSLRAERRVELQQAIDEAEIWAGSQVRKVREAGNRLSGDLIL